MPKQPVNYLLHHQEVNHRLSEDDVSPIDISVYNALFLIWNDSKWADVLSINRQDVMKMAKVGNKNTYTASLKTLHEKGYIIYEPSHNPLVGSLVSLTTFGKSGFTKSGKCSGTTSGKSSGTSGGTLYKQVETEKLLNTLKDKLSSADAEVSRLQSELAKRSEEVTALKAELVEERKKSSAQKKKEEKTEHWKELVDEWFRFYGNAHRGAKPTFNQASGSHLKTIVKNLKERVYVSQTVPLVQWDVTTAVQSFRGFLISAWQDNWIKQHFSLSTLVSKYDEIVNRNEQPTSKNGTAGVLNAATKERLAKSMAAASGGSSVGS